MAELPPGTPVIYAGRIDSEYAESYTVEAVCACPQCAAPEYDGGLRYRLRGAHVQWDRHEQRYEPVHGADLTHVQAEHVVPSPEGPHAWQVNMQILGELGIRPPDRWQII